MEYRVGSVVIQRLGDPEPLKINQKKWLTGYLEACIANGRKPPEDLSQWTPWLMSESRLAELRIAGNFWQLYSGNYREHFS